MTQTSDETLQSQNGTTNRLGFHYFPDTLHYSDRDLQIWLPLLKDLQVGWIVLRSETRRGIPEAFLAGLQKEQISPIIQFQASITQAPKIDEANPLIEAYSHWGVKYIQVFDRPNMRSSWPRGNWVQQDLVERFLDRWLPFARTIASYDISPVFPALEPGGNFWDTAFLRTALESLERRKETAVLNKLVLSAYAWTFNRPITWGAGGPEVWPEARAYFTPSASEDHLGFCVFDWYQAISTAVLDQSLPIILLQAGLPGNPDTLLSEILVSEEHTSTIREILNAVNPSESLADTDLKSEEKRLTLPADVLACNFWLLASDETSQYKSHSWFSNRQPVLAHAREIANNFSPYEQDFTDLPPIVKEDFFKKVAHPIKHYLLLPAGDLPYLGRWFTRLLPYIQKHNPTIGFSLDEAFLAIRVTVAGNQGFYPDEILQQLRDKGCQVERINENGTSIAM